MRGWTGIPPRVRIEELIDLKFILYTRFLQIIFSRALDPIMNQQNAKGIANNGPNHNYSYSKSSFIEAFNLILTPNLQQFDEA